VSRARKASCARSAIKQCGCEQNAFSFFPFSFSYPRAAAVHAALLLRNLEGALRSLSSLKASDPRADLSRHSQVITNS
jgi:hypothetical protein